MNRVEWLKTLQKAQGFAIEIGVGQGFFSLEILKNTNYTLYSIDCWEYNTFNPIPEQSYQETISRLTSFKERSIIIKSYSIPEIANKFQDNSIDLIYIDGDHYYDEVKKDLLLWYPKVKKGGIFSGHDYSLSWGVKKAVDELFKNVTVIPEGHPDDGNQPSWVIKKV